MGLPDRMGEVPKRMAEVCPCSIWDAGLLVWEMATVDPSKVFWERSLEGLMECCDGLLTLSSDRQYVRTSIDSPSLILLRTCSLCPQSWLSAIRCSLLLFGAHVAPRHSRFHFRFPRPVPSPRQNQSHPAQTHHLPSCYTLRPCVWDFDWV